MEDYGGLTVNGKEEEGVAVSRGRGGGDGQVMSIVQWLNALW